MVVVVVAIVAVDDGGEVVVVVAIVVSENRQTPIPTPIPSQIFTPSQTPSQIFIPSQTLREREPAAQRCEHWQPTGRSQMAVTHPAATTPTSFHASLSLSLSVK